MKIRKLCIGDSCGSTLIQVWEPWIGRPWFCAKRRTHVLASTLRRRQTVLSQRGSAGYTGYFTSLVLAEWNFEGSKFQASLKLEMTINKSSSNSLLIYRT